MKILNMLLGLFVANELQSSNTYSDNYNADTEFQKYSKLYLNCIDSESNDEYKQNDLYKKVVYEAVRIIDSLSKEDVEKLVVEKEIAYLSLKTTGSEMVFNAYRNVLETKYNWKYVSVVDRLMKGKRFSESHKKKLSEALIGNKRHLGKHWYNNSVISVLARECPEGFVKGRIKK